jgi:ADP-ribose pyrophosphatase YjhB (NUDIX family)
MTEPRRISARGIIFTDGKLLSQQLTANAKSAKPSYWCTPGGGLDIGESIIDCLHREMVEETGIPPKIGKLLFVQQFNENNHEYMDFFFHIENPEDYRSIDLTATTHGELEIEHVEFINPQNNNVLPAFLQTIAIQEYIDNNLPVFIYDEL